LYYQNNPDYKKCKTCKEWKLQDDFYFHSRVTGVKFNECKTCQYEKDRIIKEQELEENGGSERVPRQPNDYADKYQREQTFTVLQILGYTYNEVTGIWTKPGVKEVIDGKIVFPNLRKEKRIGTYRSKLSYEVVNQILEYKDRGWNNKKIGDKLGISDTTVFKYYKKWTNTSK
jgi:hypothetical protein